MQSFKPGEIDAENAYRLGQQFADEVLKGKYEYVISTHVDKMFFFSRLICKKNTDYKISVLLSSFTYIS
ncbi:relaxase/mobilization nuclease domain-containing protein [Fusicatenibacter saccharivorans]|uniref:relaxase/mobilization nuclease domain-containing protein n=1 Tax=Fusicatenibacter saccharivorans TaxID=1150298 RepID=UPI003A83BCC2